MKLKLIQFLTILICILGMSSQTAQKTSSDMNMVKQESCCPKTEKATTRTIEQRWADMDKKLAKLDSVSEQKTPLSKRKKKK